MADADIASLTVWPLREPVSRRAFTVVRLVTKGGLKGYGECGGATAADVDLARSVVVGRPATSYEAVRSQLGSASRIQAAVTTAMLDITGRLAKAPVYQILGGPTRNRA